MVSTYRNPASGLAAARMSALLTYHLRDSFENRFGPKPQTNKLQSGTLTPPASPKLSEADKALAAHKDGLRNARSRPASEIFQLPTAQIFHLFCPVLP